MEVRGQPTDDRLKRYTYNVIYIVISCVGSLLTTPWIVSVIYIVRYIKRRGQPTDDRQKRYMYSVKSRKKYILSSVIYIVRGQPTDDRLKLACNVEAQALHLELEERHLTHPTPRVMYIV